MTSDEYFLYPLFDENILHKKNKLIITIYGPYGPYTQRMKNIAKKVRQEFQFADCHLVSERSYDEDFKETIEVRWTKKSYHYLKNSHAIVFIFFCDEEGKPAHQESAAVELKHMKDSIPEKIICSLILKDKTCKMATVLEGEVQMSRVKVIRFEGKKKNIDIDIVQYINSTCVSFLKDKFNQLI